MGICLHLHISGKVQGVCYRISAQMQATELGLKGFARNLSDGCVEIIVMGNLKATNTFVDWCHKGPAMAEVSKVCAKTIDCAENFGGFDVRY